jgi:hypothetical protein
MRSSQKNITLFSSVSTGGGTGEANPGGDSFLILVDLQ